MPAPRPIDRFRALVAGRSDAEAFDVGRRRAGMEAMARRLAPPADIAHAPVRIAGIACEWVTAPGSRDDHVVVWMHGGGFVAGSCHTHRGLAGEIARHAAARVLTIDYRLAPEHTFPAAVDDCRAVYDAVATRQAVRRLAVGGDSAGGALALGLMQDARDTGRRQPDAAVLLSPWLDLRCSANAYAARAASDPMIQPDVLRRLAGDYLGGHPAGDPAVSPGLGVLAGLPPILVQVGSDEVLLDDSLLLDRRGREAGVAVTIEVWAEMVHVFQAYHMLLPDGGQALARVGRFLRAQWG